MSRGLTRVRFALSWDWVSKTVTTDAPRYVPHLEWRVEVNVLAPTPVRSVVVLRTPESWSWGLVDADPATDVRLRVDFFPRAWSASDVVHVQFGWQRAAVEDPSPKADPRAAVHLTFPKTANTGELVPVAELPEHRLDLAMLVIVDADTEHRRIGRWRVKPQLVDDLPPELAALARGHQHGTEGATVARDSDR